MWDPAAPCVIAKAEGFIILPLASLSPMSPYMQWKKDSRNTSDTLPLLLYHTHKTNAPSWSSIISSPEQLWLWQSGCWKCNGRETPDTTGEPTSLKRDNCYFFCLESNDIKTKSITMETIRMQVKHECLQLVWNEGLSCLDFSSTFFPSSRSCKKLIHVWCLFMRTCGFLCNL